MSKLLPNLPIKDLTPENDYLGIIEKGDLIKSFLENNTEEFSQIKMFTLYGEWGSGKSTLMKYLQKELNGTFNTYFFESWEYESDDNLPLSLLEHLVESSTSKGEAISKDILDVGEALLIGFAKSIRFNLPGVSINAKEIFKELEKTDKEPTFYQKKKEFKKQFINWENIVLKGNSLKFNIIFIDDLDRCEPENVLNLLSALKLFFTYGEKTILFCGIDKKAVREAIQTKYSDSIKSSEYLEKVFDISFSMSKTNNLNKLIVSYFPEEYTTEFDRKNGLVLTDIISKFFFQLRFTNPRKIKKVLNRFLIIEEMLKVPKKDKVKIPEILDHSLICFFDLIITLYLILLKEFYPQELENIQNDSLRVKNFALAIKENTKNTNSEITESIYIKNPLIVKPRSFSKNTIAVNNLQPNKRKDLNLGLILTFLPINPKFIGHNEFISQSKFNTEFRVDKKDVQYYFCDYLLNNLNWIRKLKKGSTTSIDDMVNLIKELP